MTWRIVRLRFTRGRWRGGSDGGEGIAEADAKEGHLGGRKGGSRGGRDARVEAAFLLNEAGRSAVAVLRHGASLPEGRLCELLLPIWKVLKRAAGSPVKIEELEMVAQAGRGCKVRAGKRKGLVVVGNREALGKALAGLGGDGGKDRVEGQVLGGSRGGEGAADVASEGLSVGVSEGVSEGVNEGVSGGVGEGLGEGLGDKSAEPQEMSDLGQTGAALSSLALEPTPTIKPVPLRGHWEHGSQVVALLLAGGGEAGIREFTQQWREVFVAALQPRFLPPGWDVQHLGRRQFGEFSVYNPQRRRYVPGEGDEGGGEEGEEGGGEGGGEGDEGVARGEASAEEDVVNDAT
ncbi:hypothetical protein CLOP_g13678 [Closterium sp. NIES-67]|nr:hypothetical protein CLOP_g13678 [Closterium sp. NIES-67]